MKKISYEVKVKFVVEVDDEDGDEDCIKNMKDQLTENIFRIHELEYGFAQIESFNIDHIK